MAFSTHIPDIEHYNQEMAKSMIDKIYFMDKVDADVFIDFGCADGTLIKTLSNLFPQHTYIGYDISEQMIDIAKSNVPNPRCHFASDWDNIIESLSTTHQNQKTCLILSSIIHEIYSYLNPEEIKKFWSRVWDTNFNYIVIRDMMVSKTVSRPSDPLAVARIKQVFDSNKISEWEAQWGSLYENWSLVHFLLTYRYTENWTREVNENYLPVNLETFFSNIPHKYYPMYIEHYTLPFIQSEVEKDFGIQLQDKTHLKFILKLSN